MDWEEDLDSGATQLAPILAANPLLSGAQFLAIAWIVLNQFRHHLGLEAGARSGLVAKGYLGLRLSNLVIRPAFPPLVFGLAQLQPTVSQRTCRPLAYLGRLSTAMVLVYFRAVQLLFGSPHGLRAWLVLIGVSFRRSCSPPWPPEGPGYFGWIAVSVVEPPICMSVKVTDWPTLIPCRSVGGLALKAMVIAGQLSFAIGPWWRVTIPALASTAVTTPAPSAVVIDAPCALDIPAILLMPPAGWAEAGAASASAMAAARTSFIFNLRGRRRQGEAGKIGPPPGRPP